MSNAGDATPFDGSDSRVSPGGSVGGFDREQRSIDRDELAIVLSHFDLGPIESIAEVRRGSRRSPKVRIRTGRRTYLLKRRSPKSRDPFRVAFAHGVQLHLAARGYPVPRLIGTRADRNSMLQLGEEIYELFEFVEGHRYDASSPATLAAGRSLGRLHALLADFDSVYRPPPTSFHALGIDAAFGQVPAAVAGVEPGVDARWLERLVERLRSRYAEAGARVEELGWAAWPRRVVHGDWHPGNLVFNGEEVAAVLDFDTCRIEPLVADLANGCLQFAMRMGPRIEDPDDWPEGLSTRRFVQLARGYEAAHPGELDATALEAVPALMIEALVVEAALPIAATGTFARIPGSSFLRMVDRKTEWVETHAPTLIRHLMETRS